MDKRSKSKLNYSDISFCVLDSYFYNYPLSVSHINSFDIFCRVTLPKIFEEYQLRLQKNATRTDPTPKMWIVRFHNVMVHPPTMCDDFNSKLYPRAAMENNITYSGIIRADVGVYQEKTVQGLKEPQLERVETLNKIQIGKVPILVRSQKCCLHGLSQTELIKRGEEPYENGGYFIVSSAVKSGKERPRLRVVIGQERSVFNHVVIFPTKKANELTAELRSQNQHELWSLTQVSMTLHTSTTEGSWISVNVQAIADLDNKKERGAKNTVYFSNLLFALGLTQAEVLKCVPIDGAEKFLYVPPEYVVTSPQAAKSQIASYLTSIPESQRCERLETILSSRLIHTYSDPKEKAMQLGYMAIRLISVKRKIHYNDDRDDYSLKRIDTAGTELAYLLRKTLREMAAKTPSHYKSQRKSTVEDTIRTQFGPQLTMMLATGIRSDNWRGNNARGASKGDVMNDLETHNWISREACKRRISTSHDPKSPMLRARQIMAWYTGFICPAETPESEKCLTLDSQVLTPDGLVPIRKLRNGDKVITVNPTTFVFEITIITNYFTTLKPVITITTLYNFKITGSKDHPLRCNGKWIDIGKLTKGDLVTVINGDCCIDLPITSIETSGTQKVADFTTLSNNHSFVANGFVTHNCGLIKNMALSAQVTVPYNTAVVIRFVNSITTSTGEKAIVPPSIENMPEPAEWATSKLLADGCLPLSQSKKVSMAMRSSSGSTDYIQSTNETNVSSDLSALRSTDKLHPFQREDTKGGWYRVFINGVWTWITMYPNLIVKKIKRERRSWSNVSATIVWLRQEVHIYTDGGRLSRPMFNMKGGNIRIAATNFSKYTSLTPKRRWKPLINDKIVEMIDICECANSYVCMGLRYLVGEVASNRQLFNLCEIHPALILGVPAQTTPSPERVQGPRVSYQASMAKQAIGWPSYAFYLSDLRDIIYMWYPRPRLVKSQIIDRYLLEKKYPTGTDLIMALMPYGRNMEDSFIMNQATVDRGGLRVTVVESYADNTYSPDEKQGYTCEKPTSEDFQGGSLFRLGLPSQYDMIESDGTPSVGAMASPNSKLISKIVTNRSTGTRTDSSIDIKSNALRAGNVRNYALNENENGSDGLRPLAQGRHNVWEQTGPFMSTVKTVKIASRGTHRSITITTALSMQMRKGDKAACYTDDHSVLTTQGCIPFPDLTLKHLVACWDPKQMRLVYSPPLVLQTFKHNGDIIDIKGDGVDLRVTDNHALWIRYKDPPRYESGWNRVIAKSLLDSRNKVFYQKGCAEPPAHYTQGEIPQKYSKFYNTKYPLAWLYFIGTFLGGCTRNLISDIEYYSVPFNILTELYNNFSHHLRFLITPAGLIDNPSIISTLRELYTFTSTFTIPDWILKFSGSYSGVLVNAITKSAMYTGGKAKLTKWFDVLQQLMLHSFSYWDIPSNVDGDFELPKYPGKIGTVLIDHSASMTVSQYSGNVYCCTVSTGVIYVRRGGVGVWCGNSTCAQKGTCGKIVPQADLPWNPKTGMSPDIIMNTHAIPSRMTIGQILGMLMGKAIALEGEDMNLTPFDSVDEEKIASILEKWGFKANGNERLRSGVTGEWYDAEIFMAPCYEQLLHHWAAFKVHARKQGTLTNVTRQPVEGRAMGGGGRFGEMEKDCLVTNGVPYALVDRTSKCSDAYTAYGCKRCGRMTAVVNHVDLGYYKCDGCQSAEHIVKFETTYAFKLLAQYIEGMGMTFRMHYSEE